MNNIFLKNNAILNDLFFSKRNIISLIEAMDDLLIQLDPNGKILFFHAPVCCATFFNLKQKKGSNISDILPPEALKKVMAGIEKNKNRETAEYEYKQEIEGVTKWFSCKSSPIYNKNVFEGSLIISRDITQKKEVEEVLKKMTRELKMINSCNQALFKIKEEKELLDAICKLIVSEGDYKMAWIGLTDKNNEIIKIAAYYSANGNLLDKTVVSWGDKICGSNLVPYNFIVCQNIETDEKTAMWKEEALRKGYKSFVVFPLEDGEKIGTLIIYSDQVDFFKKEEVKILGELSNDLSYGIISLRERKKREKAEQNLLMRTEELERINDLMIGRELKMIELKKGISDLKDKVK